MNFILMIDDDDDHRELFAMAAKSLQIKEEVVTVKSGPLAFDHLQARADAPALILVDVKMPGMDGPGTVRMLRSMPALARVPMVMISTSDEAADLRRSRDAGADSYVRKPLGNLSWADTLSQLIAYWRDCDVCWTSAVGRTGL